MSKARKLISLFLVIIICLCGATVVTATEIETDWSSYDWENFSIVSLEYEEWRSMYEWLSTEADVELLFDIAMKTDGYFTEDMCVALHERFKKDPVGLIMTLVMEEKTVQTQVSQFIVYAGAYHPAEFTQFMNGLTLPEDAGPAAMNILVQMVNYAEETRDMDITNPHTGDPIGIAALLMAVSGLGGTMLWKKRKTVV